MPHQELRVPQIVIVEVASADAEVYSQNFSNSPLLQRLIHPTLALHSEFN